MVMKEIQLSQGKVAIVNDERFEFLNSFKWSACKYDNNYYAIRHTYINSKRVNQRMHILIMGDNPLKLHIDHRDGNGLNNQDDNLRFCTRSQNLMNQYVRKNKSSKYKGVCWDAKLNKFRAQIKLNKKTQSLGQFNNEIDAAKAYNVAAKELFKEFARLNIV
jgi:hypothetical protein